MTADAKFNRLSISVHDFEQAIAFSEEAQRSSPGSRSYEALVFAAIVCYYRPFSSNEKDKDASAISKLELDDFSPLTIDEAGVHEKCKELRNQALAHSGYRHNPTSLNTRSRVISSRPFSLLSHAPNLVTLINLAQKLAKECHGKRADYVRDSAS